jgi:hypothetical protein
MLATAIRNNALAPWVLPVSSPKRAHWQGLGGMAAAN